MSLWFKGGGAWATWDGYNIFFSEMQSDTLNSHTPRHNLYFGSPFVLFLALRCWFCSIGLFWSSLLCKHLRGLHKWTTWRPKAWLQNLKGHYDKMHATYFQVEWRCWKIKCTSVWWKSIGFHRPWCGRRTILGVKINLSPLVFAPVYLPPIVLLLLIL